MNRSERSWRLASTLALLLSAPLACGDDEGETSDSEGDSPAVALLAEPKITLYPEQPMIVDIELEFPRPTHVTLEHSADPGVRVVPNPDVQSETHGETSVDESTARHYLRVRGLRPETLHRLELTARLDDGTPDVNDAAPLERAVEFVTPPALPDFQPIYEITRDETAADAIDPSYRAFTMAGVYSTGYHSATVIDPNGVTRWHAALPNEGTSPTTIFAGLALRDDGSLLFTQENRVSIVDELTRERVGVDADELGVALLHHDVIELPGGSLLALGTTFRELIDPTLDPPAPGLVAGDRLVEFRMPEAPGLPPELLWSWDAFDHLDTQRVRLGFDQPLADPISGELALDWTHANAVVHDPRDDSLLLSLRHQDWILKIDRASGAILWRLGIEGDFTLEEGAWFFHQHSPQWQPDGSLLVYDNGCANPYLDDLLERSRAVIYTLDPEAGTARVTWSDELDERLSAIAGDADRLPGGNLMVLDSFIVEDFIDGLPQVRSLLRELDPARPGAPLWSARLPLNMFLYRATPWTRLPGERGGATSR